MHMAGLADTVHCQDRLAIVRKRSDHRKQRMASEPTGREGEKARATTKKGRQCSSCQMQGAASAAKIAQGVARVPARALAISLSWPANRRCRC